MKNQNGFSLVETLVSAGLLSIVGLAFMQSSSISLRTIKSVEDRQNTEIVGENLKMTLEEERNCLTAFGGASLEHIYNTTNTGTLRVALDFTSNFPNILRIDGLPSTAPANAPGWIRFNKRVAYADFQKVTSANPLSSMSNGDMRAVPAQVRFMINKRKDNVYGERESLTLKPVTIVLVFRKPIGAPVLDHCYARGSGPLSEVREMCNSLGGIYLPEGCRFAQYKTGQGNFNNYEIKTNKYLDLTDVLCEIEKNVIKVEKIKVAAITTNPVTNIFLKALPGPDFFPFPIPILVPGIPSKDSATKFCKDKIYTNW